MSLLSTSRSNISFVLCANQKLGWKTYVTNDLRGHHLGFAVCDHRLYPAFLSVKGVFRVTIVIEYKGYFVYFDFKVYFAKILVKCPSRVVVVVPNTVSGDLEMLEQNSCLLRLTEKRSFVELENGVHQGTKNANERYVYFVGKGFNYNQDAKS